MTKPFEPFHSDLNWQQVSLLLDTVLYFEEAPKLLLIPDLEQERIAVPLLADSLRMLLGELDESQPFAARRFGFSFNWTNETEQTGELVITLPSAKTVRQPTKLTDFSPV
ncbi:hypothetical protein LOK74_07335 [Brevibacillus humidisoli]|uniref:hypothetical protein n=1 Tax=Brevibacillus humidisoli TaxID=2895522 RepID=UPI001E2F7173|nr:hypothetical protein [Brevibacillus humidisoli]UFJ42294.1 hypothetical protein LOK74_07335 [Brevibacillus humidisoli]